MVERIRNAQVAEEIAAQAGTDETPPLFLNEALTPVIFGPQRPPLAASGYFPGCMGLLVAAVPLNFSQAGLFVSGTNADSIVRVNRITIINSSSAGAIYAIKRVDDASGFTLTALVPGYINAGNPSAGGVFSAVRSNSPTAAGVEMATVDIEAETLEHFDGPWILNNGAIIIHSTSVNVQVRAYISYEHWPSIRRQPIGG